MGQWEEEIYRELDEVVGLDPDEERAGTAWLDGFWRLLGEPRYWHLPSLDRAHLFYTPDLARRLLGPGWRVSHLGDGPLEYWGVEKRAFLCVAGRRGP